MTHPATDDTAMARPLFFSTVVWGEKFRNYLTNYQLRSLLAPGNLPADVGRKKRILICGPREDWEALDRHDVVKAVRQYADVEWIEFDPARNRQIRSMAIGMSLCLKRAKECDAYLTCFPPDSIFCDRAVELIDGWIKENLQLVLIPAFRCEEVALLTNLSLTAGGVDAISRTPAEINRAVVRSLHSQMLVTDIDSDCLFSQAHAFHVRDEAHGWLVCKSMAWANALLDLRNVSDDLVDETARSVLDSYIVAKMYRPDDRVRFLPKLNDFAMSSWAPADWSSLSMRGHWLQRIPFTKRIYNDYVARKSLRYHLTWNNTEDDWIKRRSLLDVTVMFGDEALYDAEMREAGRRLDEYLRRTCPDLLHIGPGNFYLTVLDLTNSALRKIKFIADALLDRDNGRRRFVSRVQAILQKVLPDIRNRIFNAR